MTHEYFVKHVAPDSLKYFMKFVRKTRTCWLWTARVNHLGYGVARGVDKFQELAHRVSWKLNTGKIPKGKKILHSCDVRNCVRPSHLWVGTQTDNVHDCLSKGRFISGVRINRNLSDKILRIHKPGNRWTGSNSKDLARKFGIGYRTVLSIVSGDHWTRRN